MEIITGGGFGGAQRTFPEAGIVRAQPFSRPMLFVEQKVNHVLGVFSSKGMTSIYRKASGEKLERLGSPYRYKTDEGVKVLVCDGISGEVSEAVIDTEAFAKEYIPVIGREFADKKRDVNTGYMTDVWYAASDVSGVARNIAWLHNPVNPDPGLVYGLGYTSAGGVITGPLQVMGAKASLNEAEAIGDVAGERLAKVKIVRGVTEAFSGATMGALRTVSLVGLKTTAQTIVTAGTILGYLSTATASALYALLSVQFGINTVKSYQILKEMNQLLDNKSVETAFQLLLDKTQLLTDDFAHVYKGMFESTSAAQLYNMVKDEIVLTEKELSILTDAEKDTICCTARNWVSSRKREDYPEIQDWDQVKDHMTLRYMKELARIKMVKEAEYARGVGRESLAKIKESINEGRIEVDTMKEILQLAHDEARFKVIMNGLLVVTCVIGIASFVLTTIFSGGTFLILGYAIMLLMNVLMAGADTYGLFQSIQALKDSSVKDKIILALLIVLTLAAVAVGTFFTGGVGPLILVLVLGALMLAVQSGTMAYAWHKHKEVEEARKHLPSLASLETPMLP